MASSSSAILDSGAATNLRIGLEHKQRGNTAFTQGDLKAALAAYHHAVLYLSGLESRSILGLVGENSGREGKPEDLSSDEDEDEPKNVAQQGQKELSLVHSNMSACYLKQQNYPRALQSANKALKCDSRNVKAKFRKVQAMRLAGDLYNAQKCCQDAIDGLKAKERKEEARESFEKELKTVEKLIAEKEDKARGKWKGFLSGNPGVFAVEGVEKGEQKQEQKEQH